MTEPPAYPPPPQFPPGPPQFQPGPAQPPRKKRTGLIIAIIVAAVVIIGGGLTAVFVVVRANSPASAAVGDCLSLDESTNNLRRADCSSTEATYRLVGLTDSIQACADVAGSTVAVEGDNKTYCLADKDADPSKAINTTVVGDCLTITGDKAAKATCGSGAYPVLAVLKNQVRASQNDLDSKCTDVDGAELAYGWSITADASSPVGTWNRIFCLGAKK